MLMLDNEGQNNIVSEIFISLYTHMQYTVYMDEQIAFSLTANACYNLKYIPKHSRYVNLLKKYFRCNFWNQFNLTDTSGKWCVSVSVSVSVCV